jgi:hypothetical protein
MACVTMKRFKVQFRNLHIFVNAGDEPGALALARVRFMKLYTEAGVIKDMPKLGDAAKFKFHATATVCERY